MDGESRLFSCALDGSALTPVTQAGDGYTYGETLSPAHDRLAFHAVDGREKPAPPYTIFTTDLDGARRTLVDRTPGHYNFGPNWSPDGRWLSYLKCNIARWPGHEWADLWLARADGSERRALTSDESQWFSTSYGPPAARGSGSNLPRWSPTRPIIAHSRASAGARPAWEWAAARPDTDHFNRDYRPDLARGGAQLVLFAPFDNGAPLRELTPLRAHVWDFRPAWNSDGSRLAFIRANVGGPARLCVMRPDGTEERELSAGENDLGADHPVFLPKLGG